MNERKRFVQTMTGGRPDHPSYGDYLYYDSTRERWEREGMPKGLKRGELFRHFGFDHIDIWGGDVLPINAGWIPSFEAQVLEDTAEYTLRRSESGDVFKALKNVPPPAMPQFVSHPLTDRASWNDLRQRWDPLSPGRLPPNLDEIARNSPARQIPLGAWFGGTYGLIRNWMGVEAASYVFYDDPSLVEEMVEKLTAFYSTLARRVFEAGVQLDWVMFWEDMAYKNGPLLSPSLYRKFCLGFYRVMVDLARRHGVRVVMLDSDGDIRGLIPIWLEAGINVMHPMEVAAGMDVRVTRREYGKDVAFFGGIDKRAIAAGRAAIDQEVAPKIRELRDGGGFIVQCDHGVPPDISYDNYRYFRDVVRRCSED